jgi:cellulose synthase/poly-beta-1,6-N-acetylglucosamine synthase-like glycosyltransferase
MWLLYISIFICLLYLILVAAFTIGWKRIPLFEPNKNELIQSNVTVVVASKNEEEFLPRLLSCLSSQSYLNFELVLVNDHSADNTGLIMENAKSIFRDIQLINAIGFGKKNALKEGILNSRNDLIITTDADCSPVPNWIETIVRFSINFPTDLIICPVKLSDKGTFFSRLQALEFTSLVASGAGAAGAGMPIMCNGANLAFTKKAWLESQNDLHAEDQSGDDVFLLQSIQKRGGVVRFLKSESALVVTEPSASVSSFFKQRRRWASKAPSYTDWHIIYTAIVVLLTNVLLLLLLGLSFLNPNYFILLIFIFGLKYFSDTFFLLNVSLFFKLKEVVFLSFLLSVYYPFYIVSVGLSSIAFKSKKW